ncbi:MAG: DNA primase [Steroidobacteraceae bacterium]
MSAAKLIDRLERIKQTAPGRWLARCPAHEDRSPSLSVRELDDGRVLVNCFAGCGAVDVLDALGLEWSALFPERIGGGAATHSTTASSSRIPARDLLTIISEETSVVGLIAADILERRTVSETDWQRLAQAAARIGRARDHALGR